MSDYVKREDAINAIADMMCFETNAETAGTCTRADCIDDAKDWLSEAQTADVAPIRHGHWIFNQDEMSLHCSYCDEVFRFEDTEKDECLDFMEYAKYCLACGTKMDGDDSDQE